MKNLKGNVVLGCWGIGGTLKDSYIPENFITLQNGPFAGRPIPSVNAIGIRNLSLDWHLPPLDRHTSDGIDLMPYILYDYVTIDSLAFDCMIGSRQSLMSYKPKKENVLILERLASDGHIIIEDYFEILNKPEIANRIDDLNIKDLSDPNILKPTKESLELWIMFYKDLFNKTDIGLNEYKTMINVLTAKNSNKNYILKYLYECISDINRIMVLAQELKLPVYEWENYLQYCKYKSLKSIKNIPYQAVGQKLSSLFDVFIPNFHIRNYNELLDIRNDPKLNAVRKFVNSIGNTPIDKDLVISANQDIVAMKNRLETFSKWISVSGIVLDFIVPSIASTSIQYASNAIVKNTLEKSVAWQMFFVDRTIKYKEASVINSIREY
ncbi:MAG: hypothetical protein KOO63_10805 [Bacteroidales bacterium]|nr:hypothetical protein [Candidatus Latescibacterota bacterium]